MSKPVIEVTNLSKKYRIDHYGKNKQNTIWDVVSSTIKHPGSLISGDRAKHEAFWALKDVNFEVHRGEVLGIIGSNGSGKSTMLKVLSQIVQPTTGTIKLHGRVASLLEVGTGFHPELTGRENIYFNGSILGMSRKEINAKFNDIIEFSEIEQFLDTPVKFYSSGMYVRLAFAVAAHLDPDILIVDEVLAVGDASFQKKSLGKMKAVAGEGRTVIFVSHSMAAVKQLCTSGIFMEKGEIKYTGTSQKVSEYYLNRTLRSSSTQPNVILQKNPDKTTQFTEFKLLSEQNKPIDQVNIGESWKVVLDYSVQEVCQDTIVSLEILDAEGQVIFMTSDTDLRNSLHELQPGKYSSSVPLSTLRLIPGNYYFRASIQEPGKKMHDNLESVPFTVTSNKKDVRELYFGGKYMGYLYDKIKWETQKD